ncbi:MAG TPA: DUF2723 domain-containing protein [Candidatus Baltobacteraceae bacterium]|nr:DUF2723 domain-containing protein [Candidatus Baltobacteraceae bacterium]
MPKGFRWVCAAAAFIVPAAVYVASASHEPGSWDTAELQGVPYILGIAHPTGFPLYVLVGYVWSHLFAVDSIAFRMNVMTAVTMAAATLAAYAVAVELGAHRLVALFAALWYAFTQDVWAHANRAEAQVLAVTCGSFAIYAYIRWMKGGRDAWFAAAFALLGLGMAAHPNLLWLFPGLLVGALIAKSRPSLRLVAGSLVLTALGLALYLYLPLRSAYVVAHGLDPTLPLGTNGGIFWNYNNPSTPAGLLMDLSGDQSGAPSYFLSSFNPVHLQAALWAFITGIGEQFGAFVLVLVAVGAYNAWKRDWRTTLFLCVACTAALLFSVTYSNESDVGRYRLLALWLAVPLLGFVVPRDWTGWKPALAQIALVLFLASGTGMALASGHSFFEHAPGEGGRWVIDAVRPDVPRGSVILVDWLDATSLAYGAYVDGSLPDRIIVSGWNPAEVPRYRQWARSRPVYILANPKDTPVVPPGTRVAAAIDDYHELLQVTP